MRWWPRTNGTAVKSGRTLFRLKIVGTSLWIIGYSLVIYNAYRDPYDLWLLLDPADVKYGECWLEVPRTDLIAHAGRSVEGTANQLRLEAPRQVAARMQQVATCYRAINPMHQTTTRFDV